MHKRHTAIRLSLSALLAIVGLTISMLSYAASGDVTPQASTATITIEQRNAFDGSIGTWVLLMPGNVREQRSGAFVTFTNMAAGNYTIIVDPPEGTTDTIRLYRSGTGETVVQRPQLTFQIADGEAVKLVIHHNLTRQGLVSVQSDPSGISFTLRGPNGVVRTGVTPASFPGAAEGQYSVQYETLEGCTVPAPKSDQLIANGRVSFTVKLVCDAADAIRNQTETEDRSFVTLTIGDRRVPLTDVPQEAWFASYVFEAARRGILAGYTDEDGNLTGKFGPGNPVTIAELAKIAHRVGGISEESFTGRNPENVGALGRWFSPFIASAEARGWRIFQDTTIDPARPATRAEVLVTFLQVLDVPLRWQKGSVFTDVTARTPYASAIETAAGDGIIEGREDADGNPLHLFAPLDPINRAELAKLIKTALDEYRK